MRNSIKKYFVDFMRDEEGASAIEYALLAAMVAVVVVSFVTPIGDAVKAIFQQIQTALGG